MYIDNVFETIQEQVQAIHATGEGLNQNYSPEVDFSSLKFEL